MATTAFQTMYRDEWIAAYERDKTTLRQTVFTDAMIKGRSAVFLVAGSGSEVVTRGGNGLIPSTPLDLTQNTVTLAEAHSLKKLTGFNIFASQSNQREIMQAMTRKEINRHIDNIIIAILAASTVAANTTASIMTKDLVNKAMTLLGNAYADGDIWGLLTPAAWAYLSDIPEFANSQWVGATPLVAGPMQMGEAPKMWMGVKWVKHTGLTGIGTSSAECYIYNKNALGYAYASGEIMTAAGFDEEQDYSFARATVYDGALSLQNAGMVTIVHDDSGLSA